MSLGLLDSSFIGRAVAEIGAGSGDNAERLLGLNPGSYTFLDGSDVVLQQLENRFSLSQLQYDFSIDYVAYDLSTSLMPSDFDIVLCEGVLPTQQDPVFMARTALGGVREGGIAVFTCMDSVSAFSEVARRFIAREICGPLRYSPQLLLELVKFFSFDFENLPGMSRRSEDWVLDTIFNPWLGEFFSLAQAIEAGFPQYEVLGVAPKFIQDWRWYKDSANLDPECTKDILTSSYIQNVASLLDHRHVLPIQPEDASRKLLEITQEFSDRVRDHVSNGLDLPRADASQLVEGMLHLDIQFESETRGGLASFLEWCKTGQLDALTDFRKLWGRGQQYISLVRT